MPAALPPPTDDQGEEVVLAIGADADIAADDEDDGLSPQAFAAMVEGGIERRLWSHEQAVRMILGHWKEYRERHPDAGPPPVLRGSASG